MRNIDQEILEEAEARVNFKRHMQVYLVINAFIWGIWYFTGARGGYWPIYSTLGWGFGLFMHYLGVYHHNRAAVDREVEKIKKERGLD